jgi:uncharacterized membrane protein
VNNQSSDDTKELDRIIFFSDAVFAIVMTLLILDIQVPDIPPNLAAAELPARVLDLWPKFFSYVLSFIVISTYWIAHHGTFRYIKSYDRGLLWLNLLFLLSVSFAPFPTSLLGEYGDQQFAVVLYAGSLAIPRLWLASIWWYAIKGRIVMSDRLDPGMSRYHLVRSLAIPFIFLLSIIVSFFSVRAAILSWFLLFAADSVIWRLQQRYHWL